MLEERWNLFVVFDAIYSEGGITRASENLKLSQPAISHALNRLREVVAAQPDSCDISDALSAAVANNQMR